MVKKVILGILTLPFIAIAFLLWMSRDEIKADSTNIVSKLEAGYNPETMGGFAVSVFTPDSLIFSKGFGYADLESKLSYTVNTLQSVASISKTIIGVALLKAEELELLQLDDPISDYLNFKVENPLHVGVPITIRHLAMHTSSMAYNEQVVETLYIEDSLKNKSLQPFIEAYFKEGKYGNVKYSKHSPGTFWSYSNLASGLAAYIIELASSMTFDDFTRLHIFQSLELKEMYWSSVFVDEPLSKYYKMDNGFLSTHPAKGVQLYPCRDLVTNVSGLTQYCQAMMRLDSKVLTRDSYKKMFNTGMSKDLEGLDNIDSHSIFWMTDRNKFGLPESMVGYNGGDDGIQTMMWFDPITELGYIFMGNTGWNKTNRRNHNYIFQTLASFGRSYLYNNSGLSWLEELKFRLYNYSSRLLAF